MHTVSQLETKFRNVIPPPPFFPLILTFGFCFSHPWCGKNAVQLVFCFTHPSFHYRLSTTLSQHVCHKQPPPKLTHVMSLAVCIFPALIFGWKGLDQIFIVVMVFLYAKRILEMTDFTCKFVIYHRYCSIGNNQ